MATLEEDFTFPATTTTDPPPHFIESPPLWREKSEKFQGIEVEDEEKFKLWSFQEFRKARSINKKSRDFHEEGKMDILWENLNDECSGNYVKMAENCDDSSSPGRGVQISCAKSLKLSRANVHMFSGKKSIVLVFIKVVKKVLLMQNSHRIKKHTW